MDIRIEMLELITICFTIGLHLWEKRDVKQPKRNELHDKPF